MQRAEQLSKKRETERAIANLNIALKIDPACASAYRGRCEVYARLGAWGVVLADTTEALSQLKRPEAWLFRQRALARAQVWSLRPCNFTLSQPHTKSPRIHDADLKTFLDDCAQALADNPADAAVLCVHGLSRIHAGDEIKPPLQLNEGVAAFIARQAALRRPSYDAALADFNAAIEADARNALAFCGRGVVHVRLQDRQAAIDDYTESIRLDPKQKDAYVSRASITADQPGCLEDWTKAHLLDPTDINTLYQLAYAHNGVNDHRSAIADWLRITELDPTYQHAYYMLGIVYYSAGDKESAQRYRTLASEMEKAQER